MLKKFTDSSGGLITDVQIAAFTEIAGNYGLEISRALLREIIAGTHDFLICLKKHQSEEPLDISDGESETLLLMRVGDFRDVCAGFWRKGLPAERKREEKQKRERDALLRS